MPAIRTKSIKSPIDPAQDGLRILATRYTVRGYNRASYNVWMPNLAPSETLLKAFQSRQIDWHEFAQRYREELFEASPMDMTNKRIKNYGQKFTLRLIKELAQHESVTLLCSCAEEKQCCHRHLLKEVIESNRI